MMRQLGGSLGVALMTTFIDKRSWVHREALLSHLSSFDTPVQERLEAATRLFLSKGAPLWQAQQQALGALEVAVRRQTALLTYMDAFRIVGVFFVCCIPLLLFFRRAKGARPVEVAVH